MNEPHAPRVVIALLMSDAALLALIPAVRMYPREVPQNAQLPALAYTNISDVDDNAISGNAIFETGRVQVTVAAKDVPMAERLIGVVRKACNNRRGLIGGISVNDVRSAGIGPDLSNTDVGIFGRSIDFLVTSRASRT